MTEAFGGPVGRPEKLADHQQGFDGEIAVRKGATTFYTLVFMEPMLDDFIADPQR